MTLIGLTLDRTTNFLPAEELAKLAAHIEQLGFESVWFLDAFGRDPFLASAFVLANTTTLMVGTGVATVYGRDAVAAAQTLQTLSEFYPRRFIMGLGASNPAVVAKRKGEWVAPLPKMAGYLEDMKQAPVGAAKPEVLAPIYIAAHAPGLQKLAAAQAQGIMTWILPSASNAEARQRIGPDVPITAQILCVMSEDAREARAVGRAYLKMYLALEYYQTAFSKAGFAAEECTEGGGSDRLIDSVVAWGRPEQIRVRVEEYANAGADRVVLNVLRADDSAAGADVVATGDWDNLGRLADAVLTA
jgi:probable F420-dependent oxidoreductase